MKHGHVTGHKKEQGSNWWYATEEAQELLRKLDAEWEAKQQASK
jgi:hypothetical protein